MRKPPYPITPPPVTRSWPDRHPGWKIASGGLVVVLLLAAAMVPAFLSGMAALRQSPVFQEALARALANPQVASELGEPVRRGRLVWGKLQTRGQFGFAHFDAPLVGRQAEGTLSGMALMVRGQWQFRRLQVMVKGFPPVDLLAAQNTR